MAWALPVVLLAAASGAAAQAPPVLLAADTGAPSVAAPPGIGPSHPGEAPPVGPPAAGQRPGAIPADPLSAGEAAPVTSPSAVPSDPSLAGEEPFLVRGDGAVAADGSSGQGDGPSPADGGGPGSSAATDRAPGPDGSPGLAPDPIGAAGPGEVSPGALPPAARLAVPRSRTYGNEPLTRWFISPDGRRAVRRYGSGPDAGTLAETPQRFFRGDPNRLYDDAYYRYGDLPGLGAVGIDPLLDDALTGAAVAAGVDAVDRRRRHGRPFPIPRPLPLPPHTDRQRGLLPLDPLRRGEGPPIR